MDLTHLAVRQDLMVGFYHPTATGAGFTSLAFDIYADGVDVLHEVFSTVAAATSFFTNRAIDLGSLASGALSGDTLTLSAVMSITSSSVGAGFSAGMIFADPPAGAHVEHAIAAGGVASHSPFDQALHHDSADLTGANLEAAHDGLGTGPIHGHDSALL